LVMVLGVLPAGATEDSLLGRTPSTITNTLQDA